MHGAEGVDRGGVGSFVPGRDVSGVFVGILEQGKIGSDWKGVFAMLYRRVICAVGAKREKERCYEREVCREVCSG